MGTDIPEISWIDMLPHGTRSYARLMRLDRPIGTWLLLLPCWWGLALAGPVFPDAGLLLLFTAGGIVMRGAGCVINDIYDRDLDRKVERTRTRPLASGQIKLWQAVVFLAALLGVGLAILILFNRATIVIGAAALILVFTYPVMKRITWWPQLFLGLTFNWGALMGWSSVTGRVDAPAFLLYIAGIFWTLGYDTIYAHQDLRDDEIAGIKSTARLFKDKSLRIISIFYVLTCLFLGAAGYTVHLAWSYYVGIVLANVYAAFQLMHWRADNPQDCLLRFRNNKNYGLIIFIAIILGKAT